MKFIALTLLCVVSFTLGAYSQSEEDIQLWLKPGKHVADLMSIKSTVSSRQMELSGKVMRAMEKNAAWFRDSAASVTDSTIFFEKVGLTKDEFEEYTIVSDPKSRQHELIKTGEETVVIKRKKNSLTFKGTGRLKALDSLKFNIALNVAIYNGKQLTFSQKSGSEDNNNPFKSPWVGYHYSFEDEGDFLNSAPDGSDMTATKISFDIGQIKNTGKTVLMFMAMRIENGRPVQNVTSICMFE
jgi:hypothetical protein